VFAPDDKTLFVGGGSIFGGDVSVREVATGRELAKLTGHSNTVASVALSRDGSMVATACHDGVIGLWTGKTYTMVAALRGHLFGVTCVAFSPDAKTLVSTARDASIRFWNVEKRTEAEVVRLQVAANDVTFSRDGKAVVYGDDAGRVTVRDVVTGKTRLMAGGHLSPVRGLALSPNGKMVATIGSNGELTLWDFDGAKAIVTAPLSRGFNATCAAFSPDSKMLAVGHFRGTVALTSVDNLKRTPQNNSPSNASGSPPSRVSPSK
jgi:WD40 repeat protein